MSRRLLCDSCGRPPGRRKILEASILGEPAEWERIVVGCARVPDSSQRVMKINGEVIPLPLTHFDCDHCGADIKPGDRACAETIWREDQEEPTAWEWEYLT